MTLAKRIAESDPWEPHEDGYHVCRYCSRALTDPIASSHLAVCLYLAACAEGAAEQVEWSRNKYHELRATAHGRVIEIDEHENGYVYCTDSSRAAVRVEFRENMPMETQQRVCVAIARELAK